MGEEEEEEPVRRKSNTVAEWSGRKPPPLCDSGTNHWVGFFFKRWRGLVKEVSEVGRKMMEEGDKRR